MLNLNKANIGKLFMNGRLDEDLYLLFLKDKRLSLQAFPHLNKPRKVVLRKGIYQYGDKNRSEEVQRLIEKKLFWQENKLFKGFVENINENFIDKFYTRCLYEAKKEQERNASEDSFKKKEVTCFCIYFLTCVRCITTVSLKINLCYQHLHFIYPSSHSY